MERQPVPIFHYGPSSWDRPDDHGQLARTAREDERLQFQEAMRFHASAGDTLNIDSRLLDRPGFVDMAVEFDGGASLHVAARHGHHHSAQGLIRRGAFVDKLDNGCRTALHTASGMNEGSVCLELLASGADATLRDATGRTALHWAAHAGSVDSLLVLMDYGADVRARDEGGLAALHKAALMGRPDVIALLLERDPEAVNLPAGSNWTPLHLAANSGHAAACEALLASGADPSLVDDERHTPLHRAASSGDDLACQILLRAGADASARTNRGETPLHLACELGFPNVAASLLEASASPEASDQQRQRPLRLAAEAGHLAVCDILLQYGADPMAGDAARGVPTAMAVALRARRADLVALLETGITSPALAPEELSRTTPGPEQQQGLKRSTLG